MGYRLTRQDLLRDLYVAFYDARRKKARMSYVRRFEHGLKANIERLCDSLADRSYIPQPSKCFIVDYPKKREVFAAQFRDRVVHHLYYNYTHELFERTFIQDTYSCIKGRGTHYGIGRLAAHIRKESQNYTVPCYVLKLDIRGYFMHINRQRLADIAVETLHDMERKRVKKGDQTTWGDKIDMDFVYWLTSKIALLNPRTDCEIVGSRDDWNGLDRNKSLFYTEDGCGLPIGNLTSQLFSNVYLNVLDQYMKRQLKCRHYGRYVDDAYVVSCDREWLLSIVPGIREYLKMNLGLDLHMGKLAVCDVRHGVEFLGAYLLPYRRYISNQSLKHVRENVARMDMSDRHAVFRTVNSYLGMMVHYDSFNIRRRMFDNGRFTSVAPFDERMTKMNVKQLK